MNAIIRQAKMEDLTQINHILETNGQINDVVEDDIPAFIVELLISIVRSIVSPFPIRSIHP